jgi:flagellar hook-associated protein 1 FlgK
VGQSVTLNGTLPEDLLIAVQGSPPGTGQIVASYPTAMQRVNPTLPDVVIHVLSPDQNGNPPGQIAITDKITGAVLATRSYRAGQPISYLGSTFELDGNANQGDSYTITNDLNQTGDNRNGLKLANLATLNAFGSHSGTFQDIYNSEVAKLGTNSAAAQSTATSAKAVADNLSSAYSSATGVSLDTEAANMLKEQQAYQACAQVITTARQMFASILQAIGG